MERIGLEKAEGLIQQLEATLGEPLSDIAKEMVEAHLLRLVQASVDATTQMLSAVTCANIGLLLGARPPDRLSDVVGYGIGTRRQEEPADGQHRED